MPFYIASQVLGAFLAAIVCLFNYSHALTIYEGSPTIRTVPGTAAFITCYALDYVSNVNAFFDACIGPFILMVAIFAVTDRTNGGGVRRELVPLVAFAALFVISAGFGYQTLWALNPARDVSFTPIGMHLSRGCPLTSLTVWTTYSYLPSRVWPSW